MCARAETALTLIEARAELHYAPPRTLGLLLSAPDYSHVPRILQVASQLGIFETLRSAYQADALAALAGGGHTGH